MREYEIIKFNGNGNRYAISNIVKKAMKECKLYDGIDVYLEKANSSDYEGFLRLSLDTLDRCKNIAKNNVTIIKNQQKKI